LDADVQLTDFGAPEIMALTRNGIRRDWSRIDLAFLLRGGGFSWSAQPVSPNSMKSFRTENRDRSNVSAGNWGQIMGLI
jgi:hypothetical protein